MAEHVGRIPLLRRRRKRPRKPTPMELIGLMYLGVGVLLLPFYVTLLSTGRYLNAERSRIGVDGLIDYIAVGVAGVGLIWLFSLGTWLAWDWLKDPWEDV